MLVRFSILVLLLFLSVATPAKAVTVILAGNVACDLASVGCGAGIPLTPTTLCGPPDTECPWFSSASFSDPVNRFWGVSTSNGRFCRTSTDGGVTWGNCTVQPFPIFITTQIVLAEASDGSLLAIGNYTDTNTCTIRRSTNNAASWSDVYTNAAIWGACGAGGSKLRCIAGGKCTFISNQSTPSVADIALDSTDNGQNWTLTTVNTTTQWSTKYPAWNGSLGIGVPLIFGAGENQRAFTYSAGWGQSPIWGDTATFCLGAMIYNGTTNGVCYSSGETYVLRNSIGAVVQSIVLPGVYQVAATGGLAISVATNVMYVVATVAGGAPRNIGVWVSQDNGASFLQIYTSPSTVMDGISLGDIFLANGCVYFSGGNFGAQKTFVKICT